MSEKTKSKKLGGIVNNHAHELTAATENIRGNISHIWDVVFLRLVAVRSLLRYCQHIVQIWCLVTLVFPVVLYRNATTQTLTTRQRKQLDSKWRASEHVLYCRRLYRLPLRRSCELFRLTSTIDRVEKTDLLIFPVIFCIFLPNWMILGLLANL